MSLDFTKTFSPDEPESPSVPDEQQLPSEQLAEAERVAQELAKLRRDGVIKTTGEASFYASLIRDVGATYAGPPGTTVDPPSRGPRSATAQRHFTAKDRKMISH